MAPSGLAGSAVSRDRACVRTELDPELCGACNARFCSGSSVCAGRRDRLAGIPGS